MGRKHLQRINQHPGSVHENHTDVVPGNDRGLSNSTVRSLYRQSTDSIWIGTDGGGINSL